MVSESWDVFTKRVYLLKKHINGIGYENLGRGEVRLPLTPLPTPMSAIEVVNFHEIPVVMNCYLFKG